MKLIQWLIMRKVKNAAGEMEAKGISISKISAILIAVLKIVEFALTQFGHPFTFPAELYTFIGSIGAIGLKEGIDRSAPPQPIK